jgi:hypothetical protein
MKARERFDDAPLASVETAVGLGEPHTEKEKAPTWGAHLMRSGDLFVSLLSRSPPPTIV